MNEHDAFQNVLDEQAGAYQNASSMWRPGPGEYVVLLSEVVTGVKDGVGWIRLQGVAQDEVNEAVDQREFMVGYYRLAEKTHFLLKRDIAVIAGKPIDDLHSAVQILNEAVATGLLVKVTVVEVTLDNGSQRTNTEVTEAVGIATVLEEEPEEEPEEALEEEVVPPK